MEQDATKMIPKWPDEKRPHLRMSESSHWYKMVQNGEISSTEFFDALNNLLERAKQTISAELDGLTSAWWPNCSGECHDWPGGAMMSKQPTPTQEVEKWISDYGNPRDALNVALARLKAAKANERAAFRAGAEARLVQSIAIVSDIPDYDTVMKTIDRLRALPLPKMPE